MGGVWMMVAAALVAFPAKAQSFEEQNTQRWGADYVRLAMGEQSAAECAKACLADNRCRAWTYVKAGVESSTAACHLKSAVPQGRADPCCTSGVAGGSSVSASHVEPRARVARAAAVTTSGAPESSETASTGMTPTGLTGSVGSPSTMTPSGMTGSIGMPARLPAMPPLAAPVTAPATAGPMSLQPDSWDDQR